MIASVPAMVAAMMGVTMKKVRRTAALPLSPAPMPDTPLVRGLHAEGFIGADFAAEY